MSEPHYRPASRWLRHAAFSLAVFWAMPYTLCGLLIGVLGCLSGGGVQRRGPALEFYGGFATLFLRFVAGRWVSAMTLGHTILGVNQSALAECREHEWVHVRQYQRWGPLFGPAYLLSSLHCWLTGRQPYRDNMFEREAYGDDT